jgi:GNAT acetyltransferase-like protein
MDYGQFIKKLDVPSGSAVPTRLTFEDVVAKELTREDLAEDVRGINSSRELIRRTRGGRWPAEELTEEFNYVDLVWHECEFRDGGSYTYAVYDTAGSYLGCVYLYPMGRRAPLTEESARYDVDVSWWVTEAAYEAGYYTKLYRALRHWLATDLHFFEKPYFSNREIPSD